MATALDGDDDLEDDDSDLYKRLDFKDQIMVMQIRQAIQSALINKQALENMVKIENESLKKVLLLR